MSTSQPRRPATALCNVDYSVDSTLHCLAFLSKTLQIDPSNDHQDLYPQDVALQQIDN